MSGLDAQTREGFLSPEVIFLAVGGGFLNEPRSLGKGSSYSSGETHTDIEGFPGGSAGKESVCNVGDLGLIPRLGRSPGGGLGNPLQYSCLKNPMDRGDWQATVYRVTESDTTEATWHAHFSSLVTICFKNGTFSLHLSRDGIHKYGQGVFFSLNFCRTQTSK